METRKTLDARAYEEMGYKARTCVGRRFVPYSLFATAMERAYRCGLEQGYHLGLKDAAEIIEKRKEQ